MDIETAIHAGATIPLYLERVESLRSTHSHLLQASRQPEEAPMVETNLSSWKTDGARLDSGECSIGFRYSAMKGILVLWRHQRVCHTNPFEVFFNTSQPRLVMVVINLVFSMFMEDIHCKKPNTPSFHCPQSMATWSQAEAGLWHKLLTLPATCAFRHLDGPAVIWQSWE